MSAMKQIDGYKIYMNQIIGKGSFGCVYVGVSDTTKEKVAVKILTKSSIDADDYLKNALFSQIKIMQCIKSENIVGFYDVMESSKNYYIVQELCDGDLSSILKSGNTLPEQKAKEFLRQIANGFLALVREGIIHRDLKPANIMIKKDTLKIGDFGFAKKSEAASKIINQTIVGSPLYMSLQVLKSQSYSSKCDIWALGFIYYEMLHGSPPWYGKSEYDLIKKIETKPLQLAQGLSCESKDFLKKTLAIKQQNRLSWDEVFAHPIFKNFFLQQSQGNLEFENKLKMIMSSLRFQVNVQNLDIGRILNNLGYKSGSNQLNKDKFYQFLKIINPDLNRNESDYIFNKTDYDRSGCISIQQIQKIMNENNINISNQFSKIPGIDKKTDTESFNNTLLPQVQARIKACFAKMLKQINSNRSSLKQVFQSFCNSKSNSLNRNQFKRLLKSVSKQLKDDEIEAAFDLIDSDNSNSIDFKQLNFYYCRVNGLPMQRRQSNGNVNNNNNNGNANQMRDEYNYQQYPNLNNNTNNNNVNNPNIFGNGNYNNPYPQQQYQNAQNPLGTLGNLMGQGFMGNTNMNNNNGWGQPMMPQQPFYPQQPQQYNQQSQNPVFNNFVVGHLQRNVNNGNMW